MACPGGCVNGGGTPKIKDNNVMMTRINAIYKIDDESKYRKSHDNPSIKAVYDEFFEKPNSHKAHELLHTHYTARKPKI